MADKQFLTEDDDDIDNGKSVAEVEYVATETVPAEERDVDPENPDADARAKASDEDEEDHPDDTEAIRERRRREKLERKQRARDAMHRDKLELDFLRKRNDELERRISAQEQRAQLQDSSMLDQRLRDTQNEIKMAEQVIAKAIAAGNGDDVTQALRIRDEAMARAAQLSEYRRAQSSPPQEPGIDPRVRKLASDFISENSWYDPQGRDEDSAIVLAIDSALVRDGYDPTTEEYWDELRARAARRLPDRFGRDEKVAVTGDGRTVPGVKAPRGGPQVGSGKEHVPTSSRKEVYISPERKQALIDAGVWDDPKLRQRYIKRYAEYDKSNRA